MSMDLHHIIETKPALDLTEITTIVTTLGIIQEAARFEAFELVVHSGVIIDGTYEITMYESNDFGFAVENQIEEENFILDSYASVEFTLGEHNLVKRIGFIPAKTYFRMKIVSTGVTSGGLFTAVYIKANAHNNPTVGTIPPIA